MSQSTDTANTLSFVLQQHVKPEFACDCIVHYSGIFNSDFMHARLQGRYTLFTGTEMAKEMDKVVVM